ncbi:protein CHROMATIN REMODELING 35-like [Mercurialis annua]|uniref:protein CHROMATIN REMODELING 35-like n=1 Tax=Mercurialis annua TaxID=3986 RepID=UPI00215F45C4|nr:protein CHROMATIN REMODELING 35-like [Mercurialis annua]
MDPEISSVRAKFDEEDSRYKGNLHLYRVDALSEAVNELSVKEEDSHLYPFDALSESVHKLSMQESANYAECNIHIDESAYAASENDVAKIEDDCQIDAEDDGLADLWEEMAFALNYSKDSAADTGSAINESMEVDEEECDHSFLLKDDLGYVCRICGIIQRSIENIFD